MNQLILQKEYQLSQLIIDFVEHGYQSNNFCLYTKKYTPYAIENLIVYIDRYPVVNDNDEEESPDFVMQNNLELFFYGEHFENVLASASHQKNNTSIEDFIAVLNYYLDNDAFMTF